MPQRILIIKHGSLGDIVLATGAMKAIRAHHPGAEITVLTRPEFRKLLERCPFVDRVWVDARPKMWNPAGLLRLRRRLLAEGFARVYDLQTSDRTRRYHSLMWPRQPEWCGHVVGAALSYWDPVRDTQHTLDRLPAQLRKAGIDAACEPDLTWAAEPIDVLPLDRPLIALIPGSSAHRPDKRWPVESFADLARRLEARGFRPVIVAGPQESALGEAIAAAAPGAVNLAGKTGIGQIVWLGQKAVHAVGNDTGPMHIFAAAGCPSTVLFSRASNPEITAPRGRAVQVLRQADLKDLPVETVLATVIGG